MSLQVNMERFLTPLRQLRSLKVVTLFSNTRKVLGLLLASWVGVLILVVMVDTSLPHLQEGFLELMNGKPQVTHPNVPLSEHLPGYYNCLMIKRNSSTVRKRLAKDYELPICVA